MPNSTTTRDQLRADLDRRHDEFVELCAQLLRRPSENPPGDTSAVCAFVADYLHERGIAHEVIAAPGQPTLPNIVASFDGAAGAGPHLVLNGHMDVFPAGDRARWSVDPFGGVVRDGKLYGRGAIDMKGGVAALLLAFTTLHALRAQLRGKLTLTLVSDEETFGPWGARYLLERDPSLLGEALLSAEQSGPSTVYYAEKGLAWLELIVETPGGHGGSANRLPNAIREAARIIADLDELRAAADADDSVAVVVNIGAIQGGDKVNMIANHCRVEVDLRCPLGLELDDLLARFGAIVARRPSARWSVMNSSPPNACDPGARIFKLLQDNAEALTGVRPTPAISLGGTDARLWRMRGVPALCYGPTAHNIGAPDEYVDVDELAQVVKTHMLTAWDFLMDGASI
jgi:succinyl-diaminopimelate desuccinylase